MPNTILIKTAPGREWFIKERLADEILTPGMLLNIDASGEYEKHGTEGLDGSAIIAVEEEYLGANITDTYAIGDQVRAVHARPGDELLMRLKNGENVSIGAILKSDGSGNLKEHSARSVNENTGNTWTQYERPAFFRSLEAVNASGVTNIQVEVM